MASSRLLCLSVLASAFVLMTGCGGGSGGGSSTMVTVTMTGATPTAVATAVGPGSFTAATLTSGSVTISVPSGETNYAVAAVCPSQGGVSWEFVWEASITDGTSLSLYCQPVIGSKGTLTGSVDATALSGVTSFYVYSQSGSSGYSNGVGYDYGGTSSPTASFALSDMAGNDRILVLAEGNQGLVAAKNVDNQTVPGALNGGNTVTFGAADATTSQAITYNNLPAEFAGPIANVYLEEGGGEVQALLPCSPTEYPALPASATQAGDEYFIEASMFAFIGNNVISYVSTGVTNSGVPASLTFPAPWSYAGPTPASLPSATFNYTGFSGSANVTQKISIAWNPIPTTESVIEVEATTNYQSGSTTVSIPNLSTESGFLAPPASGAQVNWSASMMQQSYGLTGTGNGLAVTAPLNANWGIVENDGTYRVP